LESFLNAIEARNKILIELDVAAARKVMERAGEAGGLSNEGILAGMHKSRLHILSIDIELRRASLKWLKMHGYQDYGGGTLPDKVEDIL
jgi:hypothetical protein